jgi:CBS domain-containing protein
MRDDDILEEELRIAHEQMLEDQGVETALFRRQLRELPTLHPVLTCAPSTPVRAALEAMLQAERSCLLVVDDGQLVGIFTEREILTKVVGQPLDLEHTPVQVCMTPHATALGLDDELVYALNQMSLEGSRYIPLVDEHGQPTALVSMDTIVTYLVERFPQALLNVPPSPAHSWPRTPDGA